MISYKKLFWILLFCISFMVYNSTFAIAKNNDWNNSKLRVKNILKPKNNLIAKANLKRHDFTFLIDGYHDPKYSYPKYGSVPWGGSVEDLNKIAKLWLIRPFKYNSLCWEQAEAISKYFSDDEFKVYSEKGKTYFYFFRNQLFAMDYKLDESPDTYVNDSYYKQRKDGVVVNKIIKKLGKNITEDDSKKYSWKTDKLSLKMSYTNCGDIIISSYRPILNEFYSVLESREHQKSAKQKEIDKSSVAKSKQESIKVKGIYLGMYYKNAISIIQKIFDEKVEIFDYSNFDDKDEAFEARNYGATIKYDQNGYVTSVHITNTGKFFNMRGLTTKEFVKYFCKAYKIPKMKRYVNTTSNMQQHSGYLYSHPSGYLIDITEKLYYEGQHYNNVNHLLIKKDTQKKSGTFD